MQENIKRLLKDCLIHLGEVALYKSKDKSYMVKVLKQQPDKLYEIGEGQFVGETLLLEVSVFDVLKPMVGDIFVIGNCKYKMHSPPLRDKSGMIWRIEASGCKMSIHIEVNSNEVIESVNAKRRKIELAIVRALNRTALWLKAQAAKEISEEKKVKLSLIRKRLRIFKAKTSRLEVLIRANLYDIRASTIGKIQKTRRGSKVGKHEFIGGFAAVMPKGNSGIFKREGRAALPIKEVKLPLKPEASRIIGNLVNYEVEKVFEKYFIHYMS